MSTIKRKGRYVVREKPALLESAAIGTQKQTIVPFESGHVPNAECATIAIILLSKNILAEGLRRLVAWHKKTNRARNVRIRACL